MQHTYDRSFMDYADASSRHSAVRVSRILNSVLSIQSVLDIGCAKGTWLAAWKQAGVAIIHGTDGGYVDQDELIIPKDAFTPADISGPLSLGRQFDLVQSLEVAEHIAESSSAQFVKNLVDHSDGLVLFSAAPPGQGGEFHINEKAYDYWRRKFVAHGFHAFDYVRPLIASDKSISFWYRYNMMLYVRRDRIEALPPEVAATRVEDSKSIRDIAPTAFRMRKALVRILPMAVRNALARSKARILPSGRF
jgi:SAM-dependent methyltransferase